MNDVSGRYPGLPEYRQPWAVLGNAFGVKTLGAGIAGPIQLPTTGNNGSSVRNSSCVSGASGVNP